MTRRFRTLLYWLVFLCAVSLGGWVFLALSAGRAAGPDPESAPEAWPERRVAAGAEGPGYDLRLAVLVWRDLRKPPEIHWEGIRPLAPDRSVDVVLPPLEDLLPAARRPDRYGVRRLGRRRADEEREASDPPPPPTPAPEPWPLAARWAPGPAGTPGFTWRVAEREGSAPAGTTAWLADHAAHGYVLVVARLAARTEEPARWGIEAWRGAIQADLERVLASREWDTAAPTLHLASWIPPPDAWPTFVRLTDRVATEGLPDVARRLAAARLAAGDLAPLVGVGIPPADPVWHARLALTTTSPRLRDRCLAGLAAEAPLGVRLQLAAGLDAAGVSPPDWLAEDGSGSETLPPFVIILGVLALLCLAGLVLARGRPGWLSVASFATLLLALVMLSVEVTYGGLDLHLGVLGLVWGMAGLVLAFGSRRRPCPEEGDPGSLAGLVRRRGAVLAVVFVVLAVSASLLVAHVSLPPGVSLENAAWRASQGVVHEQAGRFPEAGDAYEEALEALDWWRMQRGTGALPARYPRDQARTALQGLLRCRAKVATQRVARWSIPSAERLSLEGLLTLPEPEWAEALFGTATPPQLARERRELLRVVALAESRRRSETGVRAAFRAVTEGLLVTPSVLDRTSALLTWADPAVRRDGLFVVRALLDDETLTRPRERALWTFLGRGPEACIPLVADLVRALVLDREQSAAPLAPTFEARWAYLARFVHELAPFIGTDLRPKLVALAGEPLLPREARAAAVELLCRVADLPFTLVPPGGGPPQGNAMTEASALAVWRETKNLSPVEAFRARLAVAVERVPAIGAYTDAWLERHAGPGARTREAWLGWLNAADETDPRTWLALASGIGEDVTNLDLGEYLELLHPEGGRDRSGLRGDAGVVARLHDVFALSVRDPVKAPVWCTSWTARDVFVAEPVALCAAWHEALAGVLDPPRFRVRAARYVLEGDLLRPLFDDAHEVRLEQGMLVQRGPEPGSPTRKRSERPPAGRFVLPGLTTPDVPDLCQTSAAAEPEPGRLHPGYRELFSVTWAADLGYRLAPAPTRGEPAREGQVVSVPAPAAAGATPALAAWRRSMGEMGTRVELGTDLRERILPPSAEEEPPRAGEGRPWVILLAGAGFLLLLALGALLTLRRKPRRRDVAAVGLVVVGLGLASMRVLADAGAGMVLLPTPPVGLAAACLGAYVLVRHVPSVVAWLAPLSLFVATILATVCAAGEGSAELALHVAGWTCAGVLLLPMIAAARPIPGSLRLLACSLPFIGLLLRVAVPPAPEGSSDYVPLGFALWLAAGLVLLAVSAPYTPPKPPKPTARRRRRRTRS